MSGFRFREKEIEDDPESFWEEIEIDPESLRDEDEVDVRLDGRHHLMYDVRRKR